MNRPFGLTMVVSLLLGGVLRAENWPEFRGPTGQGIVAAGKLPVAWDTTKNVVWKQAIPGKGWSSPIIHDGRVYLTTAVPVEQGDDHSLRALSLDAKTGKVLWDEEVFRLDGATAPRVHTKNSHASPTPLTDGKRLYVHFGHQGTAALDLDGKVLWKNNSFKYRPVHGAGGTPIFAGDALVFSCDGGDQQFIVALNRATGEIVWKTPRKSSAVKKFSFSTPLLITVNKQELLISPGSDAVCAYDPKTGKEIWRARYDGYSVIPRPVFGHGLLFVLTGYDYPSLMAIRPDGQGDVTKTHVAWTAKKAVAHTPSLLLAGDELYMVSDAGIATCMDAKTGKVHWQERLDGNFSASPVLADGKIYFQSEQGVGTVIKAGKQFEVLSKNDMGEATLASYAAAEGALFLRTEKHLYRIQEK